MGVVIVLRCHVRRDDQWAFVREVEERLGPALEIARGFKQLHLVHDTSGSATLLAIMEWSGDSMFSNFANQHNLFGDFVPGFATPHALEGHRQFSIYARITRKAATPRAKHRD